MFIIYIDDLAKLLEHHGLTTKLFADDVKVYLEIKNADDAVKLQAAVDLMSCWASEWQLSVSVSKCHVLTVGHNQLNTNYELDGCQLPRNTVCRDLGIMVTSNLSPTQHINAIVVKAHQRVNNLLRCFTSGDKNLLVRAFTVYVRPLLEYNSVIWSPCLKQDIILIEKV